MYASTQTNVFLSTDNGITWTATTDPNFPIGNSSRIELAVSPANDRWVYAIAGDDAGPVQGFIGLYRSADHGVSWNQQSNTPNILSSRFNGSGATGQAFYDLALAVNPSNLAVVNAGGVNAWRSVNFGNSWTLSSHWREDSVAAYGVGYTHADIHHLEYNNGNLYSVSYTHLRAHETS